MEDITLESVITYTNFFRKLKECNRSVDFKYSVQEFDANACTYIHEIITDVKAGKIPEPVGTRPKIIYERGKKRIITPIDIRDRLLQKVICDEALIPSIMPHLIYDNGASIAGKGTDFARQRLNLFLEEAKREYGAENIYVLVLDFKSFFDSIPHRLCLEILLKYVSDKRLVDLSIGIIESYQLINTSLIEDPKERAEAIRKITDHEGRGICLGSQISQVMAVSVLNGFDHFIKDQCGIRYYIRYMDDAVILSNNKSDLMRLMAALKDYVDGLGMALNERKTHVTSARKGFTFLKVKYQIAYDGKTVKRLVHSGITRERRRLNKFPARIAEGRMSYDDVYNNIQSWNSHAKIAKSRTTTKSMFTLYDEKYGGYRITRKYYREHPEEKRRKKVVRE